MQERLSRRNGAYSGRLKRYFFGREQLRLPSRPSDLFIEAVKIEVPLGKTDRTVPDNEDMNPMQANMPSCVRPAARHILEVPI